MSGLADAAVTRRRLAAVPETAPRAIRYGRVSATMGRGEDLTSPELQDTVTADYCRRRGYQSVEWLVDVDRTGRSWSRRQVEHCVRMVEQGLADVIVVPRWSRFTRNLRDYVIQTARIEAAGGRIESALEETDPATAAGLLQRDLFAILAQWESRKLGEQWKETHERRRREGLPHEGFPKLGYSYEGKRYAPDPKTAPVMVDLYQRYVAGQGFEALAIHLERLGMLSPRTGVRWTARGVKYMMDTGFAAGLLHTGGYPGPDGKKVPDGYLPGAHEAIVGKRLWQQYLRARARRTTTPPRLLAPTSMLAGLVRCGGCGESMSMRSDRHAGPGYAYSCRRKECPAQCWVRRAAVELAVEEWLREYSGDVEKRRSGAAAYRAAVTSAKIDRRRLAADLAAVERAVAKLTAGLTSGLIEDEDYRVERDRLRGERERTTKQLEMLTETQDAPRPSLATVEKLLDGWGLDPLPEVNTALRELLRVHVSRADSRGGGPTVTVRGRWES